LNTSVEFEDGKVDQTRLARAVSFFAEFHEFEDGNQMVALCDVFAERFTTFLHSLCITWPEEKGGPWDIVWFRLDDDRPLPDVYPHHKGEDHCVVRVGPYIYDWTIRQYTDETSVPFVWSADVVYSTRGPSNS